MKHIFNSRRLAMPTCLICLEFIESIQLSDIKCKNCNWDCCQECMSNYLQRDNTKCFMCDFKIVNQKSDHFLYQNSFDCWFQQGRVPLPNYCPCSNCLDDEW